MSVELKNCPICDHPAQFSEDLCNVYCTFCGCEFGEYEARETEELAEYWNSRPIEDALRAELSKATKNLQLMEASRERLAGEYLADCKRLEADLDRKDALIAALQAVLLNIVSNARIQPDSEMGGLTDCYGVPIDDIVAARARLAAVRGEACPK